MAQALQHHNNKNLFNLKNKLTRTKKLVITAALSVSLMGPMLVALSVPVEAATWWSHLDGDAKTRFCATKDAKGAYLPGCAAQAVLKRRTRVAMKCWYDETVKTTGLYSSKRWFYVVSDGGVKGFVHSSLVGNQWPSAPSCSDKKNKNVRGIWGAWFAATKIGTNKLSKGDKAASPQQPAPTYWSSWCYLFTYVMHKRAHGYGPKTGVGTAYGAFQHYSNKKVVSTNWSASNIKIGAIVFYGNKAPGHAAIYLGQGKVATTVGTKESQKINLALTTIDKAASNKRGWVAHTNF